MDGGRKGSLANSLLTRFLIAVELGFVGDGDVFVQSNEQAGWEPPPLFLHVRGASVVWRARGPWGKQD